MLPPRPPTLPAQCITPTKLIDSKMLSMSLRTLKSASLEDRGIKLGFINSEPTSP